jgi:hypothetical protein
LKIGVESILEGLDENKPVITGFNKAYPNGYRIGLEGSGLTGSGGGTVIQMLRETVSFGKGLIGVAFRDVVQYLQAYAAVRLQAFYRGHKKCWRYMAARLKWIKKNIVVIKYVFKIWFKKIRDQMETRKVCRRKIIAWRFYMKSAKKRRNLFRLCFWPFYVWRKYVSKKAVGKEKAKFLVLRVIPTVLTMTVFRAWKVYAHQESALNRCANKFLKKQMDSQVKYAYSWLRYWSWQRRVIRQAWIARGLAMRRKVTFIRQNTPFQIWKAYVHFKRLVRNRLAAGGLTFKALFVPYAIPRPFYTKPMKKKRAEKEALRLKEEAKRQVQNEIRKRIERENKAAALLEMEKRKLKATPKMRPMDDSTEGYGSDDDTLMTEFEESVNGMAGLGSTSPQGPIESVLSSRSSSRSRSPHSVTRTGSKKGKLRSSFKKDDDGKDVDGLRSGRNTSRSKRTSFFDDNDSGKRTSRSKRSTFDPKDVILMGAQYSGLEPDTSIKKSKRRTSFALKKEKSDRLLQVKGGGGSFTIPENQEGGAIEVNEGGAVEEGDVSMDLELEGTFTDPDMKDTKGSREGVSEKKIKQRRRSVSTDKSGDDVCSPAFKRSSVYKSGDDVRSPTKRSGISGDDVRTPATKRGSALSISSPVMTSEKSEKVLEGLRSSSMDRNEGKYYMCM